MNVRLQLPPGSLEVVTVAAHPDDVEIACGATLLSLCQRGGISVRGLCLTGDERRRQEATAAASAFVPGSMLEFGGFDDGYLPEAWGDVKRTLHRFASDGPEPGLVLVPWDEDAHQDHRLVGQLAPKVWRSSLILHYEIPKWDGDLGRPSVYVSVDERTAHRKRDLLDQCYPSQHGRDWWTDETFFGLMRLRGIECKSQYAEAFHSSKLSLDLSTVA